MGNTVTREQVIKSDLVSRVLLIFALLLIVAVPLVAALYGIIPGAAGDELSLTNDLSHAIESGIILPVRYNYPSLDFDISLIAALPYAGRNIFYLLPSITHENDIDELIQSIKAILINIIKSDEFAAYLKIVFICLSLLVILWVLLIVWYWRQNIFEALIAAALVGGSWEINYHSRYLTPNALMMQFGFLTLLLLALAHKPNAQGRSMRWRYLAAACAGIVCGTKYQGGIFLFIVWIDILFTSKSRSFRDMPWRSIMYSSIIFAGTFLLTTPGLVLQPVSALRAILYEIVHYQTGHPPHTVSKGFEHLHLLLGYIGLAGLSRYVIINVILALFVILGIFNLLLRRTAFGLLLVLACSLYIGLMINQRVMFVRNYQILIPFVAIFAARGIFVATNIVTKRISALFLKKCIISAVGLVIVTIWMINIQWLFQSADNLRNHRAGDVVASAYKYIEQHINTKFFVSSGLKDTFRARYGIVPPNAEAVATQSDFFIFYASELTDVLAQKGLEFPINRFAYFTYFASEVDAVNPNYLNSSPENILGLYRNQIDALNISLK